MAEDVGCGLGLPKIFADGCVLQRSASTAIWGWSVPDDEITVGVDRHIVQTHSDARGRWRATVGPLRAGGPVTLRVSGQGGRESLERQCYVGDVFLCSGQSNMELAMSWVAQEYPREFTREEDPCLRQYKVTPDFDFEGPHEDHLQGIWTGCNAETIKDFSALAYFFGRELRELTGVPIGILNVSLGGSTLEAWMDKESLRPFPRVMKTLDHYLPTEKGRRRGEASVEAVRRWHDELRSHIMREETLHWHRIVVPCMFDSTDLSAVRGEVVFRTAFFLRSSPDEDDGLLRLGTMTDSDITEVNGVVVGSRPNQYELRDYAVPRGVLHAGANEIRIRLTVERGNGRITPDKPLYLRVGDETIDLSGEWLCAVASRMPRDCPREDFVRWKPTGLYNAMLAPCVPYTLRAVLWYQGESNTGDFASYHEAMLQGMIRSWRGKWGDPGLPFLIVQLPNFSVDCVEDGGWPVVREAQRAVGSRLENVATVVTLDVGEPNDLHPVRKKPVAHRLVDAARALVYGERRAYRQPRVSGVRVDGDHLDVAFEDCDVFGAPCLSDGDRFRLWTLDGRDPGEFCWVWSDGGIVAAPAHIDGNVVRLRLPDRTPDMLRYAWRNNPCQGLLCNDAGILVSPLSIDSARWEETVPVRQRADGEIDDDS